MEKTNYLPLGSVVTTEGGMRKLIIVGRGLFVKEEEESFYFDYAAVPYPAGVTGEQMIYFNHDAIDLTLFIGYNDDDNLIMNEMINNYVETHPNLNRKTFPAPEAE